MTSYHLNYILKEAITSKKKIEPIISKYVHMLRYWQLGLQHINLGWGEGGTIQPLRVLCSSVAMVAEYICGQYTFDC